MEGQTKLGGAIGAVIEELDAHRLAKPLTFQGKGYKNSYTSQPSFIFLHIFKKKKKEKYATSLVAAVSSPNALAQA